MEIQVTNLNNGEIVPHSLVVLSGFVRNLSSEVHELTLSISSGNVCHSSSWPIVDSKFKLVTRLAVGHNKIEISCGSIMYHMTLIWEPTRLDRFVRLVYILCRDSYGRFQSPKGELNTIESACQRISLGAEMIQVFIAEELKCHKLGRKTFSLEYDEKGQPLCHTFRLSVTAKEAEKLSDNQMWLLVAKELMNSPLGDVRCKFLAFLSFTQYANPDLIEPSNFEEVVSLTKNHVSLGGGGLALLGTACLHTWPQNDSEILHRLTDMRVIDKDYLMDHSNYRGYYWACFATTLGAACHELGHTFNLGHNPKGIMGRGFNDFNRAFMYMKCLKEECCQNKVKLQSLHTGKNSFLSQSSLGKTKNSGLLRRENRGFSKDAAGSLTRSKCCENSVSNCCFQNHLGLSQAVLDRSSAFLLFFHKWFKPAFDNSNESLKLNRNVIESPYGIRVVEIRKTTRDVIYSQVYDDGSIPTKLDLGKTGLQLKDRESQYIVVAEDSHGSLLTETIPVDYLCSGR